ncbi:hypothetical protein MLD38_035001 [Melastoma candidum]|uniref:Uncharacterized protein n=1 Tax=Melastoma candidum TaxID=119954 RepID=A0ACB9MBT8_9MYRT|nr:hypothetical protein MLD38_035001 [Melastoma candidum]
MDRRSWPWKKKSSDKSATEKAAALLDSANAASESAKDKGDLEKPSHVQVSVETYSRLSGLEEKVKTYEETIQSLEERIEELNEKLSTAEAEITTKEDMVKQHSKVAEEAVSGWEKAEAEALALKGHLESVMLEKLAAEDRASHLDGALKECMRQTRNLKEEHEKNLQEVVLIKTKQLEKIQDEFEAKIASLDQELLTSVTENAALSRSLQERSNMVIKLTQEKSSALAEIELLKSNIESCEREIGRFKYEVHLVTKELDIRNEEKNMSVRSAEVANKQHIEGVKKIAKLEAECQRLRGLVRKKLPGPAALAQMRVEVESLGRDYGDPHFKRSPVKPSSPHPSPIPDFCFDNLQKVQRENEFLTERLYAMEEEAKVVKEALAKRNSELQVSRSSFAKTTSKLHLLEAQMHVYNASNPPSLTSMSEDGNDEDRSVTSSWAASLMSDLTQIKKVKNFDKPVKDDNSERLELMDDFLEMEKLANNPDGTISTTGISVKNHPLGSSSGGLLDAGKDMEPPALKQESSMEQLKCVKLQSRILSVLEKNTEADNVHRVLEEIKQVLQEAYDIRDHKSVSSLSEEKHCSDIVLFDAKASTNDASAVSEVNSKVTDEADQRSGLDLEASLSHIHEFILILGKEAVAAHDISVGRQDLIQTIEDFSTTYHRFLNKDADLTNIVDDLSRVFSKARQLKFNILDRVSDSETTSPDCIDKVALPENGAFHRDSSSRNGYRSGRANIMDLASNSEISDDSNTNSDYEASTSVGVLVEDYEKLRSENEKLAKDLAISNGNLETMKSRVEELEQTLVDVKSQLAASQKSYSLAETQLKCMAESYRSLEERAEELQMEVELLRAKINNLRNDLHEEKNSHQDTLAKFRELEERLLSMESSSARTDGELKSKQEHDLTAAAEKLAECQETIFMLGRQLKALHPQTELPPVHPNLRDIDPADDADATQTTTPTGNQSPVNLYMVPSSPSESEPNFVKSPVSSKRQKHRATLSGSSTSSSSERQSRGFSRFFSTKG